VVDAQQPGLGAPQEPAQPGLLAQLADEFAALGRSPGVRPADQPFEVGACSGL
jgi:hypothetical protein